MAKEEATEYSHEFTADAPFWLSQPDIPPEQGSPDRRKRIALVAHDNKKQDFWSGLCSTGRC
jgi:hypothetical protein